MYIQVFRIAVSETVYDVTKTNGKWTVKVIILGKVFWEL